MCVCAHARVHVHNGEAEGKGLAIDELDGWIMKGLCALLRSLEFIPKATRSY